MIGQKASLFLAVGLYAASAGFHLAGYGRSDRSLVKAGVFFLAVASVFHAGRFFARWQGAAGFSAGDPCTAMDLFGAGLAGFYLLSRAVGLHPLSGLGFWVAAAEVLVLFGQIPFAGGEAAAGLPPPPRRLTAAVAAVVLSHSLFALAFLTGGVCCVCGSKDAFRKKAGPAAVFLSRCLWAGLALWGLGILAWGPWMDGAAAGQGPWNPDPWKALAVLAFYAAGLFLARGSGWRGRVLPGTSLAGFPLIVLGFKGVL